MSIGFKVKKLREIRGFSQEYVSEKIGISQAQLSKMENDEEKKVSYDLVTKLSDFFHVPMDYFEDNKSVMIQNNNNSTIIGNNNIVQMTPDYVFKEIKFLIKSNLENSLKIQALIEKIENLK